MHYYEVDAVNDTLPRCGSENQSDSTSTPTQAETDDTT